MNSFGHWFALFAICGSTPFVTAGDSLFPVAGRVVDHQGRAVEDAIITAVFPSTEIRQPTPLCRSGEDGGFDFGGLGQVPFRLVVSSDRYSPQSIVVESIADAAFTNVTVLPGRRVRLKVTDWEGNPVAAAKIRSVSMQNHDGLRISGVTDDQGRCSLRGAPSSEVTYQVSAINARHQRITVSASGDVHEVSLDPKTDEDQSQIDVDPNQPLRQIFHLCHSDGTVIRPLINDQDLRDRFGRQGTPDVSVDGSTIAFDAYKSDGTQDWQDCQVVVANIDGSNARIISDGMIPSLSPDGKKVVFSRARKYGEPDGASGQSIWMMNCDGTGLRMIADRYAWGGRWTADGRQVVFRHGPGENGRYVSGDHLRIYDLATQKITEVWDEDESQIQDVRFHFNVSCRGRLAAVTGRTTNKKAVIGVMHLDQGIESFRFLPMIYDEIRVSPGVMLDIHPSNRWITIQALHDGIPRPVLLPIEGYGELQTFPNLPADCAIVDPISTPDGKHLIVAIRAKP